MNSNITDRTFWSNDGWFMNLRKGDEDRVSFIGSRRVKLRAGEFGVIAGPFNSLVQMETWFIHFLSRHAKPRADVNATTSLSSDIPATTLKLELLTMEENRMQDDTNACIRFA